jgi:hypothetical protein
LWRLVERRQENTFIAEDESAVAGILTPVFSDRHRDQRKKKKQKRKEKNQKKRKDLLFIYLFFKR